MEFLQLEYFKAVARLQHMTKAAKKLKISQPALSATIARLEEEIGVPLFDRVGRQIQLNKYGKSFLARVNNIFYEIEDGKREIQDLANTLENSISIAILLPHVLPNFLEDFLYNYPNSYIHQFSSSRGKTIKQLENFEVDFAILVEPIQNKNIVWKHLYEEPIYLSVARDHKFANVKTISLNEVKNENFISYGDNFEFRKLTDMYCQEAGFKPKTKIELEDPISILRLVELGYGVAFTPKLSTIENRFANTVQIPIINPEMTRTIGISWNKNHYLSKGALQFKKFIYEYFTSKTSYSVINKKSIH